MILGDLGADVIKVERPGQGDESRGWGPPFDADGESAYYLCCNRNKLSVALDLDATPDRELLYQLMRGTDVVLENFREGALANGELRIRVARTESELDLVHDLRLWSWGRPARLRLLLFKQESGWMSITGDPVRRRR
jgi:hypothetical protein